MSVRRKLKRGLETALALGVGGALAVIGLLGWLCGVDDKKTDERERRL